MQLLVTVATFCVFLVEALFHYNIGVNGHSKQYHIVIPKLGHFLEIALVVAIFSIINGFVIRYLH